MMLTLTFSCFVLALTLALSQPHCPVKRGRWTQTVMPQVSYSCAELCSTHSSPQHAPLRNPPTRARPPAGRPARSSRTCRKRPARRPYACRRWSCGCWCGLDCLWARMGRSGRWYRHRRRRRAACPGETGTTPYEETMAPAVRPGFD